MQSNMYQLLLVAASTTAIIALTLFTFAPKQQYEMRVDSSLHNIDYSERTIIKQIIHREKYIRKYRVDRRLPTRLDFASLLDEFGFKSMIEIGVRAGDYAYELLQNWPGFEHYYGIDPYEQQANYIDGSNRQQAEQEQLYSSVLNRFNTKFGKEKITMIRNYSTRMVGLFKKESIDFIYIDARHDYCGVSEDMEAYYPILKCGGLFSGHDYEFKYHGSGQDWGVCGNGSRIEGSVKRAVLEFVEKNAIPLIQTSQEEFYRSWFFFKSC
jgi:hypothetical protein